MCLSPYFKYNTWECERDVFPGWKYLIRGHGAKAFCGCKELAFAFRFPLEHFPVIIPKKLPNFNS